MKTQTKIALIFFALSLSIILLLSLSIYYFSTRHFYTEFNVRLKIRAVVAARVELDHQDESATGFREIREKHLEKLPDEKEYFFAVRADGNYADVMAKLKLPKIFFEEVIATGNATHRIGNTLLTGLKYESRKGSYIVIVSASNRYYAEHQVYLRHILIIAILLATMLTFFISILFSKKVFNPVRQITDKVKEISSEHMHLRVEQKNYSDEISDLVTTFNHMLDRLETAFETQNNFISNASHELGNPLTAIIGEADVALSKDRAPADYRASLQIVLNEAERLERITKSLLFLAQTGFDRRKQSMQVLRADQLIWDVKETIDRLIPDNKVYVNLNLVPENYEKLKIRGNAQLLHLAISNLVNNGCKYSGNKPVEISIGSEGQFVSITIRDEGIGIPPSELKYIYDPFFRASNTRQFEGYGIGLPLSRNIIRMHGGSLQIETVLDKGTTVHVSLPLTAPAPVGS